MAKLVSFCMGLSLILGFTAVGGTPALAAPSHHHHHHHHHHHKNGGGGGGGTPTTPVCGPGTVLVTSLNLCVSTGANGGSPGGSGITVTPTSVSLTPAVPAVPGQGSFSQSFTMSGLPPLTNFVTSGGDANCPMSGGGAAATGAGTSITFTLANAAATCQQGLHGVTATAGGTPFTAYVLFSVGGGGGGGSR